MVPRRTQQFAMPTFQQIILTLQNYWAEQGCALLFTGLPDPKASVLKLYGQEVNLFKLGRMPAQLIIDRQGVVRFVHYGHAMSDIPENGELFEILDELNVPEGKAK